LAPQANVHIASNEPWKLIKDPARKDRLDAVLWYAVESVRLAALMLQPIMPRKASEILDQLGVQKDERSWEFARLGRGWGKDINSRTAILARSEPMFPPLKAKS
jgi:methionyl-tRNA synthetase